MTEYLALVRHGETLPNILVEQQAQGLFYEVSGADETVTLTEFGVEQIVSVGKWLAKLFTKDNPLARILVSGYKRTDQSADPVSYTHLMCIRDSSCCSCTNMWTQIFCYFGYRSRC